MLFSITELQTSLWANFRFWLKQMTIFSYFIFRISIWVDPLLFWIFRQTQDMGISAAIYISMLILSKIYTVFEENTKMPKIDFLLSRLEVVLRHEGLRWMCLWVCVLFAIINRMGFAKGKKIESRSRNGRTFTIQQNIIWALF